MTQIAVLYNSSTDGEVALMTESILLAAARLCTFSQQRLLTNASSFFFERDNPLFLLISRHVVIDEPSNHFPDRIEVELHTCIARFLWGRLRHAMRRAR